MPTKPKLGRPPLASKPLDSLLRVRLDRRRKAGYVRAAKPRKLSEWVLEACDEKMERES